MLWEPGDREGSLGTDWLFRRLLMAVLQPLPSPPSSSFQPRVPGLGNSDSHPLPSAHGAARSLWVEAEPPQGNPIPRPFTPSPAKRGLVLEVRSGPSSEGHRQLNPSPSPGTCRAGEVRPPAVGHSAGRNKAGGQVSLGAQRVLTRTRLGVGEA